MDWKELYKIWESIFLKLGCVERVFNNWCYETQELIVVLSFRPDDGEKDFYINIGIFFKRWDGDRSIEEPICDDYDIGQAMWVILNDLGEMDHYLNNLFCYHADINTDEEIKNNSYELARLFKKKVIPYIDHLDSHASLIEDFEEVTAWKPFCKYFRPNDHNNDWFCRKLERYYRWGGK
jgi:hypothetical protein